jgi:GDP-L-fucose synthase
MLTSQECAVSKSGAAAMNDPASSAKLFDLTEKRVFVAGHRGMVGSAIVRRLRREQCEVLTADRNEVDLLRQGTTECLLAELRPHLIVVAAGKVGGIHANETYPAEFIYENLAMATNLIHGAYLTKVNKLLFLGSSCIYPQLAPQPISEEALLTGPLESTNEWYAIAKIAGLKLCQAYRRQYGADFICVMPTNLFGPGDNYHPEHGHVIAALMRRFHEAKMSAAPAVRVWGTGSARRDFMHVDDLADACITVLERYSAESPLNIGLPLAPHGKIDRQKLLLLRPPSPQRRLAGAFLSDDESLLAEIWADAFDCRALEGNHERLTLTRLAVS